MGEQAGEVGEYDGDGRVSVGGVCAVSPGLASALGGVAGVGAGGAVEAAGVAPVVAMLAVVLRMRCTMMLMRT